MDPAPYHAAVSAKMRADYLSAYHILLTFALKYDTISRTGKESSYDTKIWSEKCTELLSTVPMTKN